MLRRSFVAGLAVLPLGALPLEGRADAPVLTVARTPSCGCCGAWIDHMRAAGFAVEVREVEPDLLDGIKARLGIAPAHASCHTATVAGYVVEGHVPAEDVRRLLVERPEALGLAVPGMPVGSPGMEMGATREPFDTLLLHRGGRAEVFASHP